MPQSFSDMTSSITHHNIKRASGHKQLRHTSKGRRASASSSASQSTQSSSSSASISTTATHNVLSSSIAGEMVRLSPTLHDVDVVRHTWGRVCERRHRKDNPSMSSAHAFGTIFYKALFELDPSLKTIFGKNVIHQARVLAGIMSYLTRSPSIKGESGSVRDLNFLSRTQKSSMASSGMENDTGHPSDANSAVNAYVDLIEHQASLKNPRKSTPQVGHPQYHPPPVKSKEFNDAICPFHQQEQEEKYQQQLLLQQKQQQEEERQRTSMQQDMQRKMEQQHQEENQWFAYKLREVGIQHIEEYNMVPGQLDALGPALITALKSRLQEEFSPQIEQAWNTVCGFTFYHMKTGMEAHITYHRRARRLSSGSYCSIEAGETNGACTIQ
ncbi:unnamed protein product [Absidia cylindrospora]